MGIRPDAHDSSNANADNAYEVIVEADDGVQATQQTLTVNVNGVNDTPTLVAVTSRSVLPAGTVYETDSALSTTGRLVAGEVVNQIRVDEKVSSTAAIALERMLAAKPL